MKQFIALLFLSTLFISCNSSKNSQDFIEATNGRYLFNSIEAIEVYFEDNVMKVDWRNQEMTPIKVNDSTFYLKEMNEKLMFVSTPKMHIKLAPKREHDGVEYTFKKLAKGMKTPAEHFNDGEYEEALKGYLAIKEKDSLDIAINQRMLNLMGYRLMQQNKIEEAKEIFKINIALYPYSSNVYDSMADAYKKENDTVKAIEYYKKALKINPENRRAKRYLKDYDKK